MDAALHLRLFATIPEQAPISPIAHCGYLLMHQSIHKLFPTHAKRFVCREWLFCQYANDSTLFWLHTRLALGIILAVGNENWFLGAYRQSMWMRIINVN